MCRVSQHNSIEDLQRKIEDFSKEHQLQSDFQPRILDLVSEIGELAKESLLQSNYKSADFQASNAWNEEMGDVFFSLICLANQTNTDLSASLELAISKYQTRWRDKRSISSTPD